MEKITPLLGNQQRLDGGAMFGHVPKALWQRWMAPDKENRITLACRALLVQKEDKNILFESGIGAFFSPELKERFGVVEPEHVLLNSLAEVGLKDNDIDAVVLSHLHFDHAGGILAPWIEGQKETLLFPKATYFVGVEAWKRACKPHARDKASFIPSLQPLLLDSDRLELIDGPEHEYFGPNIQFLFSNGHTPGLMQSVIYCEDDDPIIFASDLIPGECWLHLPVGMGYDRCAELVAEEKQALLDFAIEKEARIFYTHDPKLAMSYIKQDEKGKYVAVDTI